MTAKQILQSACLNPNKLIFSISREEAVEKLIEFIKDWELSIEITDIRKEDWKMILNSYCDSIITYHPENDHQERAAFLKNKEMLKKYGLTDEDILRIDFC